MYFINALDPTMETLFVGMKFTIMTGHNSLKNLLQQMIRTSDQQLCLFKLLGYEFDIKYNVGWMNGVADALSRMDHDVDVDSFNSSLAGMG